MSRQVSLAIVDFPGSAADEAARALSKFPVLDVQVVGDPSELGKFDALLLPPGASYGDYLRPGAIAATGPLAAAVKGFAKSGGHVLGIGNGFQILTELGLLPGVLLENEDGRFASGDAELEVVSPIPGFDVGDRLRLPFAHRYGRYWCNRASLHAMEDQVQVLLKYTDNPNGSLSGVAAVSNWEGNVVGMMPQPTRALDPAVGGTDGIAVFDALVRACKPGARLQTSTKEQQING